MKMSKLLKRSTAGGKKSDGVEGTLAKAIKKFYKIEKKVIVAPKVLRVSQLCDMCPREQIFMHVLHKEETTIDVKGSFQSTMFMDNGTDLHTCLQDKILGPMRILKGTWACLNCLKMHKDCYFPEKCSCGETEYFHYIEYIVTDLELGIKGHIDGLICLNRLAAFLKDEPLEGLDEDLVIFELKSTGTTGYSEVVKTKSLPVYYRWQATKYQEMAKAMGLVKKDAKTWFLYLDRQYFAIGSFFYEMESDILLEIAEKAGHVWKGIAETKLYGKRKCETIECERAKGCLFRDRCFLMEGKEFDEI